MKIEVGRKKAAAAMVMAGLALVLLASGCATTIPDRILELQGKTPPHS
jgi:hypothetical protein